MNLVGRELDENTTHSQNTSQIKRMNGTSRGNLSMQQRLPDESSDKYPYILNITQTIKSNIRPINGIARN